MPTGRDKKAFALRLDPVLHETIERLAAAELRSVNAQIECLLREGLSKRGIRLPQPEHKKRGRPPKASESKGKA